MVAANHIAYTALINPPNATPVLSMEQIWPLLQRKIQRAQDFVPGAILSTDVLSKTILEDGSPVTTREVVFREGNRRVREDCVEYAPMRVEFRQPDGSKIQNIVSEGVEGELYMTYAFEWRHPELEGQAEALREKMKGEKEMARKAVEGTIKAMRKIVAGSS